MPFPLALSNWEEWRIWKRRSHVTVKHLLSDLTAIPIVQILSLTSPMMRSLAIWEDSEEWMIFLEEAITCHRQALALRPHGHPYRSSSLYNLANAVSTRFKQLRITEDLEDAVKYLSEAKHILPTDHPFQLTVGSSLASIHLIQCDIVPKSDKNLYKTKAFELFDHAANHSPASAKDRFHTAVLWAREAHLRGHQSSLHAYTKSLTLLGHRLILAPTIESQQNLLATVPKALALNAASSSIDQGDFRSAIELLEQGRAILWSKLRGYRHPLDKLRTIDKELFDQFVSLHCLLMILDCRHPNPT